MISKKAQSMSSEDHVLRTQSIGEIAERRYYRSCRFAGRDIEKTTKNSDIAHVDYVVNGETVDVKGLKPSHKKGLVILEIKNVKGEDGWCSSNGPQWIAFDFGMFFIEVFNQDLVGLVKSKCDLSVSVDDYKDCLYKAYTRTNRKDIITMVTIVDVMKNCNCRILEINE